MMTVYIVNKYIMQAKNYGMISWRRTFWKTLKSQISQVLFRRMLLNHSTGLPSLIGYFCLCAIGGQYYFNVADRGIELLLQFFHAFFTVLSERFPWLSLFVVSFPSSLYLLKKHFGLLTDDFQKFVVCPKCNSLYNYDSTFETRGGKRISKRCSYVDFPNHRHRAYRKACNEVLLKEVKLQDGKTKLYPRKVYCYNSIIETLKKFLQHPNFSLSCELWRDRERTSIQGLMSDVIHGSVWRNFKGPDGSRFTSH